MFPVFQQFLHSGANVQTICSHSWRFSYYLSYPLQYPHCQQLSLAYIRHLIYICWLNELLCVYGKAHFFFYSLYLFFGLSSYLWFSYILPRLSQAFFSEGLLGWLTLWVVTCTWISLFGWLISWLDMEFLNCYPFSLMSFYHLLVSYIYRWVFQWHYDLFFLSR